MKVKTEDIRKMSVIERDRKLEDLKKDLFKTRSSAAMGGTMADPSRIRMVRRSIARLLTVKKENNEI